jgi:maltose O-acetyltransferase
VIHPTARIECDELVLGEGTVVRAHAEIYGTRVVLGRESFIDEYAVIGGGSAGELVVGDWFHLGMFAQVNTARPVTIGDEVGVGIGSRIFTHGAYLSELDGFPATFDSVSIGDRVWLPNAIVMPGVTIGSDVVVAAGSVVTGDIPSNTLAAGVPAKAIRKDYPEPPVDRDAILQRIVDEAAAGSVVGPLIYCDGVQFDVDSRTVSGTPTLASERLRNQLRRHGIRFPYWAHDTYEAWE